MKKKGGSVLTINAEDDGVDARWNYGTATAAKRFQSK